jgi:hypothetical protein
VTGSNWEGIGVRPEVPVPAANALRVAHLRALERLLAEERDAERRTVLQQTIDELGRAPAS